MNEASPVSAATPPVRAVPEVPTVDALLALFSEPLLAAARGRGRRDALFGRRVRIQDRPNVAVPEHALVVRGEETIELGAWPSPSHLRDGDHIVAQVEADAEGRDRWARWLAELAASELHLSIAPCSRAAAGLHPLWCVAVARIALGPATSVVARHDLLGTRLAQVALGFGADALAGPIDPDRSLPLCGVPRPDEKTTAGLSTLVRHAGLTAITEMEERR